MKPLRAVLGRLGGKRRHTPIYASSAPVHTSGGRKNQAAPHSDSHSDSGPALYAPTHSDRPVNTAELTVGDYANGIPNIKLGEVVRSFFRQLPWMIPMLLLGVVGAWFLTADFKRTYTGEGSVLVQLGDEYVYQPIAGTANAANLMQTPDTIALNEIALIKNSEVMDRVIGEIAAAPGGLTAFAPEIASKMAAHREGTTGYQLAYMELRKMMDESFHVGHRPKSSVIDMAYEHPSPEFSVSTLNRLMDAYLTYRRTVFVEGAGDVILQRREDTEEQLAENERLISAFLKTNNISDFESEQAGARERTENLKTALNTLRGEIAEAERSLATVEDQLRTTPQTIDLYTDDRLSNRLAQAQLERQQLLAKYLPTSDPVRDKEREIEQIQALQQRGQGQATGGRRVGVNTVYQALETQRNTLQAQANSLREKEFTLQQQLNAIDGKLRSMTALSPRYNDLLRARETLNERLKTYLVKEQEALINQQQAESSSENVRILSRATYPIKGRNMRMLAFAFAVLAWGFTLVMLALFRVFSDPRLYARPEQMRVNTPVATPVPMASAQAYAPSENIPEPVQYSAEQPYAPGPEVYQPAAYIQPGQPGYEEAYHGYYNPAPSSPYPDQSYAASAYAPQPPQSGQEGPQGHRNAPSDNPYDEAANPYLTGQQRAVGY